MGSCEGCECEGIDCEGVVENIGWERSKWVNGGSC